MTAPKVPAFELLARIACAAVLVATACGPAADRRPAAAPPKPAPPPQAEDPGLAAAQDWLSSEAFAAELDIEFGDPTVDPRPPCVLDFEHGSGPGGNLEFLRLDVGPDTTRCERVTWQASRLDPAETPGRAVRAEVETKRIAPLLDAIRALSAARVKPPGGDARGGSSADEFFVLVRVPGPVPSSDRTWEFAGYEGRSRAAGYVPPRAVVARARAILDPLPWSEMPVSDLRKTHFPDAFVRNREICCTESHGWVMERSIEALGWFGDRSTIPAVEWIRGHAPGLVDRQTALIRRLLGDPARYLEGPPASLTE